jgi:hypothetical protein
MAWTTTAAALSVLDMVGRLRGRMEPSSELRAAGAMWNPPEGGRFLRNDRTPEPTDSQETVFPNVSDSVLVRLRICSPWFGFYSEPRTIAPACDMSRWRITIALGVTACRSEPFGPATLIVYLGIPAVLLIAVIAGIVDVIRHGWRRDR